MVYPFRAFKSTRLRDRMIACTATEAIQIIVFVANPTQCGSSSEIPLSNQALCSAAT